MASQASPASAFKTFKRLEGACTYSSSSILTAVVAFYAEQEIGMQQTTKRPDNRGGFLHATRIPPFFDRTWYSDQRSAAECDRTL